MIRGAPTHPRDGGFAVVLCNWYHQGENWSERLQSWATDNGCDAWLLCFKTDDPLTYAANWLRSDVMPSGQVVGSHGAQIRRVFASQDLLDDLAEECEFLEYPLLLVPNPWQKHV